MRYNTIKYNDTANVQGISVSIYLQGCPHKCFKCFNPETWDFDGGKEFTPNLLDDIIVALHKNGINRSFCILGGEPLCGENLFLTCLLVKTVKERSPQTPIWVWTGYTYEELYEKISINPRLKDIFNEIDVLVDGPYIDSKRDITLQSRGSSNQRIIYFDNEKKL